MKNKKKVKIDLGNDCLFEDGEIKSRLSEEQKSEKWMTWDEGWQWVINSLEKIANEYERNQTICIPIMMIGTFLTDI